MGGEKCPDGSLTKSPGKCPSKSKALNAHADAPAADLIKPVNHPMAEAIVARMAKKPEDLAKYQPKLRAHAEDTSNRDEIDPDIKDKDENYTKRSPENAEFSRLFAEVQNLAAKAERENSPLLHGFISRKGEKEIVVNWHNGGEGSPGFYLQYGNEVIDNDRYYQYYLDNDGNLQSREPEYAGSNEITPNQRKQIYLKEIAVLKKVVEILKRGFKFPEPRYMVVKTTPESKKNFGVATIDSYGKIPPNALVKVLYTDPNNGNCYVIAKSHGAAGGVIQGFVDGKSLEPYDAGKFHPEVSPIKKAFVKKNKETEENGGLNLRNAKNEITGKVPLGVEMTVLALESTKGKYGDSVIRALVQFKSKNKVITGFVAASFLDVK